MVTETSVGRGMATATKRAMAIATRVVDAKESAGDGDCNCDSDYGGRQ
jgi:hypothetical protein